MSRPEGVSDGVLLAAIGSALAVCGSVWTWAGLAGSLFGRGWPHQSASDVLLALTRLPARLSDPATAWPEPARSRLPDAAAFYATLALLAMALVVLTSLARRVALPAVLAQSRAGARWAHAADLRPLKRGSSKGASGARLTLGFRSGRRVYAEQRHAIVAFGPPQSGKSAGLAIPALLEWEGPAVASSIKTDLLGATLKRRNAIGPVFVFDPFALAAVPSHTWSPLNGARSWDGALEVAWRLASAGELDRSGVEGGDFWALAAEQRLAPLLYAAAGSDAGIQGLVRWAYGQGAGELDRALAQITGEARDDSQLAGAHAAYDALRGFELQADRTRSSIEATAQTLLRAYRFSRVARSAESCEITGDRVLDENTTLYLIGDAKTSKLLRPIFLALLSEVVDRAYERATLAGGALARPLLLCLDEAGNVAPLPNLAEVASTAPSHGIQLVSIFHDIAQARARYGRQAETVINSHHARMLLPGVADLDTLRYFGISWARRRRATQPARLARAERAARAAAGAGRWWRRTRSGSYPSATRS